MRKRLSASRLIFIAASIAAFIPTYAADAPGAAKAPAVSAVSAVQTIPFTLEGNRILVDVSGPGFGPRPFLLDTGAQLTHYTAELVEAAALRKGGRVGITGTGTGRVEGFRVEPALLRIGTLDLRVGRGIAAPAEALFGAVYQSSAGRFDGVIGYDLFAAYVVEIDYGAKVLRLYDRERPPPQSGDRIPLRIVDNKPYLESVLRLGGTALPARLHLDTGFGGTVGLNGRFVSDHGLVSRVGPTLASWTRGVGGTTEARLGRFDSVEFGRTRLVRPIVSLALVQGAGVRRDSAGRLGGEALRRFSVTLDYRRGHADFSPNSSFGLPFEADMSGLALANAGGLRVERVEPGTPAAEAAIQAGDVLLSVDGAAAESIGIDAARALFRQEGARRWLQLMRNGRSVEVSLTLRRRL